MYKSLKRMLPIFLGIVIICSLVWYLFSYDQDFTRDMLLYQARNFEEQGNHSAASWLYELAYQQSGRDETVAIELAERFKANGNYTKAEVTLANAIADGGSVDLYIALCRTYVEQDKLLDAVNMLDNIADPAIKAQIATLRPAAPTATPDAGYYSQYVPVTISCQTGKLYLTTDGVYPTTEAEPSDGIITLPSGETTIHALAVDDNGLVSPLSIFGYTISGVIEEVTFKDNIIETVVRDALGVNDNVVIFTNDLWTLSELQIPEGTQTLADLTLMPYLEKLSIVSTTADNLDALSGLSYLAELSITDSYLSTGDLTTIAALPALQRLTLNGCGLSSIGALSGAIHLTHLDLSENAIRDLSALGSMRELTALNLSNNALEHLLTLPPMPKLQELDVSYNSLPTVELLSSCTAMKKLNISNNFITSIAGLEALTGLEALNASFNAIEDVTPLAGLTALLDLDLSSNQLVDITCLEDLKLLQNFSFSRNQVTALPAWPLDSQLVYIDGSNNSLTSVKELKDFFHLNYVVMDYNNITSVDDIAECFNLVRVSIYGCPVKDVSKLEAHGIIVNYNPLG
jgi:internalin A